MPKCHPKARDGESIHALIKRSKKPNASSGRLVDGELKVISCQCPLHDMRAGAVDEHLHSDELGVYDGVVPPPMICNRCAVHNGAELQTQRQSQRAALKRALRVDDAALDELIKLSVSV